MAMRMKLLAGTMIFLLMLPAGGLSDTIWLKSGKKIETGKTVKKGSNIQFVLHGLVVNIAQKDILRIEEDSPAETPPEPPPSTPPPAELSAAPAPTAPPDTATRPVKRRRTRKSLANRTAGFRGLFWGTPLTAMKGLRPMGVSDVYGGIAEYKRPYDPLVMGQAELESIVYGFLDGRLATITIWTRGHTNFTALARESATRFGPGKKVQKKRAYTIWGDGDSHRMLVYYKSRGRGLLWMQAAELEQALR